MKLIRWGYKLFMQKINLTRKRKNGTKWFSPFLENFYIYLRARATEMFIIRTRSFRNNLRYVTSWFLSNLLFNFFSKTPNDHFLKWKLDPWKLNFTTDWRNEWSETCVIMLVPSLVCRSQVGPFRITRNNPFEKPFILM